jgi:hypothetical protein
MSNAQVLYLENLIVEKCRQERACLRKVVGHLAIWSRLRPYVADAHDQISKYYEALSQAKEELGSWPKAGKWGRMNGFEDQISMRRDYKRLANLTLQDGSDCDK